MSESISIISCDNVKFTLPHSIYSQFNFFLSNKESKDTSSFQLKFTSKALTEIIDLLNEDKRGKVLKQFPKTCDYLQFLDYDINVGDKIINLILENKLVQEFPDIQWNKNNIDKINNYTFDIKCDFVRDTKKHKLKSSFEISDSMYKLSSENFIFNINLILNQKWKFVQDEIFIEITCKIQADYQPYQSYIDNKE